MPYVSKDDIMLFIPDGITVQQGASTNVNLVLYKDYINNQLNAADADSIVVTLYNAFGQKTYQYANPIVPGQTDLLTLGQPASDTQGHISFEITAAQAANLANGALYAQVTITYSNYYPSAKTYILPQLEIGSVAGSSVAGPGDGGSGSGTSSNSDSVLASGMVAYNVGAIDGSLPQVGKITTNSPDPTLVTDFVFYNLDAHNYRNVLLENFLMQRSDNNVDGTITIYDINNPAHYSIYKIVSYTRINSEAGGGDDNDNDLLRLVVSYEDSSYTPIENAFSYYVGQSISYALDAFGSASGTPTQQQPGQNGTSGTSGIDGLAGRNGDNGTSGTSGISGTSGVSGTSGTSGADGIDGNHGTSGTSGVSGTSGTSGADGIDGNHGTSGTSGADGIDGDHGTSGTSGVSGTSGTSGADGIDGDHGTSGTSGVSGTSGADGIDGNHGTSGTSGVSGTSGTSGADGAPGMGITFKGAVATQNDLPSTNLTIGDAYIADDTDHLYVWDGTQWVDGGSIQGPAGQSGTSGTDGTSGNDGTSGTSGADGINGENGTSGTSGVSGTSGTSGVSGDHGTSGTSGVSGTSGTSGAQGIEGPAGSSGTSGVSGTSGTSGANGENGTSGTSGANGENGTSGTSGVSGTSGTSGANGENGTSGTSGADGTSGSSGSSGVSGANGSSGTSGSSGSSGNDGVGIPSGGTSGQVLTKVDSSLYNVTWSDPTGGSGGAGYTKYLLRLNYDTQEDLIAGTTSHSFVSSTGYETTGASISAVTAGPTGSISVQFNENNPPISVMVMAYNPVDDTYKVHHYDKDAANTIINTSSSNFTAIGNNQYEPDFFGNFTVGMTLDTRQDYMKFGNSVSAGFPPVTKNAHVYVIFVF